MAFAIILCACARKYETTAEQSDRAIDRSPIGTFQKRTVNRGVRAGYTTIEKSIVWLKFKVAHNISIDLNLIFSHQTEFMGKNTRRESISISGLENNR